MNTYNFMIKMVQFFFCHLFPLHFLVVSFKFTIFIEQVHSRHCYHTKWLCKARVLVPNARHLLCAETFQKLKHSCKMFSMSSPAVEQLFLIFCRLSSPDVTNYVIISHVHLELNYSTTIVPAL